MCACLCACMCVLLGGTHMAAPQEFWVFHQSVFSQLFVEQIINIMLQTVSQLEKQCYYILDLITLCNVINHKYIPVLRFQNTNQENKNQPIPFLSVIRITTPISMFFVCFSVYLYVQGGEVAVHLFLVINIRLTAHRADHVSDVFVSHCDGEMLPEALMTNGALT